MDSKFVSHTLSQMYVQNTFWSPYIWLSYVKICSIYLCLYFFTKNLQNATRTTKKFNKVTGHKVSIYISITLLHTNKQLESETKQKYL